MNSRFMAFAASVALLGTLSAQPLRVPPDLQEQKLIHRAKVVYPQQALSARISGTVKLNVLIDDDGLVRRVQLVSGHPLLVRAAMAAVKKWRYRPTYVNGRPAKVLTTVEVPFVLPNRGIIEPAVDTT